jgi:hypothetical protein
MRVNLVVKGARFGSLGKRSPARRAFARMAMAAVMAVASLSHAQTDESGTQSEARGNHAPQEANHWAFQPPRHHPAPDVRDSSWPRSDVDRFVLAAMEQRELRPGEDADRATLLRRLSFDLIGLPPSVDEVNAFVADTSESAVDTVVDRLLSSPRFGEKWGRHWLDVARYAESTGKTVNFYYPNAWRYRDYVIASFNNDKPYDEFVCEQLAGDLMPTDDPREHAERLIATGFLAIGPKTLNERNGLQHELDLADEQIDVTTQAFLGLTVSCARCHDHKFDPIPMSDYYAMAGIFRSTETLYGTVRFINAQRPSGTIELATESGVPAGRRPMSQREAFLIQQQIRSVQESLPTLTDPIQRLFTSGRLALLQARLDGFDENGSPRLLAMGVRDKRPGPEPRRRFGDRRFNVPGGYTNNVSRTIGDSPVYFQGEADQPSAERVPRGTLEVIKGEPWTISDETSGRQELADWIVSADNPLTSRVIVNRIWLHLFGRGLVATADDFGHAGTPPSHPELLDTLAVEFVNDGWSIKKLIRSLVLSRTYQLSSTANAEALRTDPENVFLWRMQPRRLEAEALRDAMLAVSGRLVEEPPIGSIVASGGEGPVSRPFVQRDLILGSVNDPRNAFRSVYLPAIRDQSPEVMATFDAADPSLITSQRQRTTVPSQALFLLNNRFVSLASDAMAGRLLEETDPTRRTELAFLAAYGRPPSAAETASATSFLAAVSEEDTSSESDSGSELAAWSTFCQALFASAEFQYRR